MSIHHDSEREPIPTHPAVSLTDAIMTASAFRAARAKFNDVIKDLRNELGVEATKTISSGVDHHLRSSWLGNLVLSSGDSSKIHYAIHAELDSSCEGIVNQVHKAWGKIFEIESQTIWSDRILLTMRPKDGREATTDDTRPATAEDIQQGRRVYIMHGDHKVLIEHKITEVMEASADYKGFCTDDGRRRGLDGDVFVLRLDDTPPLPRL